MMDMTGMSICAIDRLMTDATGNVFEIEINGMHAL